MYFLIAVDMRLEHFPIVDSRLPRLSGVAQHQAIFELANIQSQLDAPLAARRRFNRGRSAKRRRIMILRAGRNFDYDGFRVAADMNPIDFALAGSGEAVQRGANRHRHRTRTTDSGARWSFGIGG